MSQYSWSTRYEIPDVNNKTDRNVYDRKDIQKKIKESIQTSFNRSQEINKYKSPVKSSYNQSLRHTTDYNVSLSDLLGKPYKYFEPRTNRKKADLPRKISYEDHTNESLNSPNTYGSSTNLAWTEATFKSSKNFRQLQTSDIYISRQKLWSSAKFIQVDCDRKSTTQQQYDSPMTFTKKNKMYCTTPSSYEKLQELQNASTKFGSPTSSYEAPVKLSFPQRRLTEIKFGPKLADFKIIKHLGEGRFGSVTMAIHLKSGFLVALKKVKKSMIKANKLQAQFITQMKLQMYFNHPNILKLFGYFDDSQHIYLILQFMQQGTLFNHLKKSKILGQKQASLKIQNILCAINYIHQLSIAHRDIKPQNIVMSNGVCKLCDFGWAAVCDQRRTTLCGTIDYAPPEVLEGKQYGITMDLWCLGVLAYQLLVGKAPFYHMSRKQTMQKIIKADKTDLIIPPSLSQQSVDFIGKLLVKDPEDRMHTQDALKHSFIINNLDEQDRNLRIKSR